MDEVIAPGELGYFGVLPGHTPMLSTLGSGGDHVPQRGARAHLTCFWGFCEVLPDRVNILAEIGERAEDIDTRARGGAPGPARRPRMKAIKDEAGYRRGAPGRPYVKAPSSPPAPVGPRSTAALMAPSPDRRRQPLRASILPCMHHE